MPVSVVSILEGSYDAHIRLAAEKLRDGGMVVLPTETVYGAAAALNRPEALKRLRQLSEVGASGQSSQPPRAFIPHLARPMDATQFLGELSEFGQRCIRKLWPGPVALIFDVPAERRRAVAASLNLPESDLYTGDTITLRCPHHPVAGDVIAAAGSAVAGVAAGAMALPGARAAAPAIDVVREMGGDLSKHRSRMLSVELIHQADMIFTMSQNHARAVTALVPSAAEKVTTLDPQGDIEDPIGGGVSAAQPGGGGVRTRLW